jgi:hypothetical protein
MKGKEVSLPALAGNGIVRITTRRVFAGEILRRALQM